LARRHITPARVDATLPLPLQTHSVSLRAIYNTFNVERHLMTRTTLRRFRDEAASAWAGVIA